MEKAAFQTYLHWRNVLRENGQRCLETLDGLSGIADDTFVHGKSEAEHDQHILNVLDTARGEQHTVQPS